MSIYILSTCRWRWALNGSTAHGHAHQAEVRDANRARHLARLELLVTPRVPELDDLAGPFWLHVRPFLAYS
jgi:hypothetical protein